MIEWPILLGWPMVFLTLALSLLGMAGRRPVLLYVAAGLILPTALYLASTPRFIWLGPLLPLSLVGAGLALRSRRPRTAWGLLVPVFGVTAWLALLVSNQP